MALNEKDWKILRGLKGELLERFCQLVLVSAGQIIQDDTKSQHARHLRLFEFIQTRDKALARAFDDITRSNALLRLAFMRQAELLTDEEFGLFSEDTREQLQALSSGYGHR